MKTPRCFRQLLATVLLGLTAVPAQACTVCFNGGGNPEQVAALNAAILLMMGVLATVLGGVIAFFVTLARRASQPLPDHLALVQTLHEDSSHDRP